MHTDGEQLDPITDKDNLVDDDLSECNLDIEFGLSMQLQMASMLSFAYIWSLGAFSPFRYARVCMIQFECLFIWFHLLLCFLLHV